MGWEWLVVGGGSAPLVVVGDTVLRFTLLAFILDLVQDIFALLS